MADQLVCSSGCKRTATDLADASSKGWSLLEISQRWRCPTCTRELEAASQGEFDQRADMGGEL